MSEHGVNVPVLRKALEHITAHPEEWDQGEYATRTPCGTAHCLAGTIAVQQGYRVDWNGRDYAMYVVTGEPIEDVAAREAGLPRYVYTNSETHPFGVHHSLHDLWRLASELTDGEIKIPPGLEG